MTRHSNSPKNRQMTRRHDDDKKVNFFQMAIKPIVIPRGARRAALAPKNFCIRKQKCSLESKVTEALIAGIDNRLHKKPENLETGFRVRLSFCIRFVCSGTQI